MIVVHVRFFLVSELVRSVKRIVLPMPTSNHALYDNIDLAIKDSVRHVD